MIRKGFTLLETIIVIGVIAMMSTVAFTTFESSRSRILYQTSISKIEESLNQAKTTAYNSKNFGQIENEEDPVTISENAGVITWFDLEDGVLNRVKTYSTNDTNSLEFNEAEDLAISEVELGADNTALFIKNFNFMNFSLQQNEEEILTEADDIFIVFNKQGCSFYNTENQIQKLMLQIPLRIIDNNGSNERTLRYLYLHSTACMPEILIDNLFL